MPPTMLIESLQGVRRRVKVLGVIYGIGILLAAAVALLLAVVLLDWALVLPLPVRFLVDAAALIAFGYTLYHWIVRPAMARLTLSDLAGRLEHVFPQFDDTLRSTITFLDQSTPGSEVMKQRTVERANTLARDVDLGDAVVATPVWYSAAGGIASLALIILLSVFVSHRFPELFHAATDRLFGGSSTYPKSVEIDLVSTIPSRIPAGQSFDIKMKLAKGTPRHVFIRYREDNGPWQTEEIERGADGVYTASLAGRLDANRQAGQLQIKLEAGDDQLDLTPVAVVPRLEIRGAVAMVTPPPYAHLPASPVAISDRPVITALGSTIDLHLTFNKAINSAKPITLEPTDKGRKSPAVTWTYPAPMQAVGRFVTTDAFKPNDPFRFTVRAIDADGFTNATSQEYQVIVHDDAMPTIQIEVPQRSGEERTPDATVPLKAVAEDDYGIDQAQLVIKGLSGSVASKNWTIDLVKSATAQADVTWAPGASSAERKRYLLGYGWALSKLEGGPLKAGDVLEFVVQVKDNFHLESPTGTQEHPWVASSKYRITIISHDQWDARVEEVLAQTRRDIEQVKKNQDVNKAETDTQTHETEQLKKFDDAQRATVSRLANTQTTVTGQTKNASEKLKELATRMGENNSPEKGMKAMAELVAAQLDRTAEGPMKDAGQKLSQAKDIKTDPAAPAPQKQKDATKSTDAMKESSQRQGDASKQLDAAMGKLSDFGGLAPAIAKIEEIKQRQSDLDNKYAKDLKDALGKKPEDLTPEEKKNLDAMVKEQQDLAQETEKALKNMEDKGDKLSKADPASSKALKEAAQAGRQQSVPQKQSSPQDDSGAAQAMQQNQQANAQDKQKQVELGLDTVLDKLKEAERRKLEQLQKDLADVQKLINELVVRQAGHNIDNLLLQGVQKVTDLSEQDRAALFQEAQRDVKKLGDMKPDLAVLTPSQEQTERNCRDYAQRASKLPDPAPASKLTAAAAKMEQAIVYLRKNQLAEAYVPPQVEALRDLVDAKNAVDEMKKKADDEMQNRTEESIKQAYVKLLENQKKLNKETTTIDATQRDAQGNLPFLVARRLGALPGEQGELSKQAGELGKRLESIGSVVYVWANKDIVSSMGEVKDDLAKPETGNGTQAEQKRIEDQLQAMVDNLAKKQKKSPFAQHQQQGGGGKGGGKKPPPRMPTDIELRLLKDLQQAVNNSTQKIAEGKNPDAHKLLALGGRQGELRGLLNQLLQKASKGQVKLGPEPDNKDQLPEEASKGDVDDQELMKQLLDDQPNADTVEKSIQLTGDRMARSRQRLAINDDPGKVTQEIQKRITTGLDDLIKLAQQQQASNSKPGQGEPKPGDQPGQPQPGQDQGQQQANGEKSKQHSESGQTAAGESTMSQGGDPQADLSKEIKDDKAEWGRITPRNRNAVLEGANDKPVDIKYRKFIEDYYRELAKKASER